MSAAQSFSMTGEDPQKAARSLALAARRVTRPVGALLFVAGALGERLPEVARAVAQGSPGLPVCLAAGAGVISERGEQEASLRPPVWCGLAVRRRPSA